MEVPFSIEFKKQRDRFGFCFTCEHCAHYDDSLGDCLHGFPNELHRLSYYLSDDPPATILFCKDFDLA